RRRRLSVRLRRFVLRPPPVRGHRAHVLDRIHAGPLLPRWRHLEIAPLRSAHADGQRAGSRGLTRRPDELARRARGLALGPLRCPALSEKMLPVVLFLRSLPSSPPRRVALNNWKVLLV